MRWPFSGLTLCAHGAQAPQHIDVKQLSKKVEDVVVPLPNEVFGALNKLGSVNWKEYVRTAKGKQFYRTAAHRTFAGTVIADGFIAVQAEDAPTVKEIGQRVLALSKGIGVGNSITPHAKAIIEAADKRKWENVRQELDRTQNSVQQAMNEVHDEKLSQLVSLGGWLRGTEVLTAVVTKRFFRRRRGTAASAGLACLLSDETASDAGVRSADHPRNSGALGRSEAVDRRRLQRAHLAGFGEKNQ